MTSTSTSTISIAPVRKTVVVEAGRERAFEVFTAGIDRWWPKSKGIGSAPLRQSVIEPFLGGRWYTTFEDGTQAVIGHVGVWQPPERFVVSWEISAAWKPDARAALASEVEVRFLAEGAGRTRIELEHRNFERMGLPDGESMRGNVDGGWPGVLDCYAREVAAAAEFVIHTVPGSPYARATLMALEEKGQPYRVRPVIPGTLREPAQLALHPFGKIPTLVHGDFRLYETQAILRYIDRVVPQPALTPADAKSAARMDQLMNINDWYLFQPVARVIVFQRVIGPRLMGLTADEQACAGAMPNARLVVDELARLLGDQPFFTGESISLADILLAPQLDLFSMAPEWETLTARTANTAGTANLVAWLDRMRARPSMAATTWERVAALAKAA